MANVQWLPCVPIVTSNDYAYHVLSIATSTFQPISNKEVEIMIDPGNSLGEGYLTLLLNTANVTAL